MISFFLISPESQQGPRKSDSLQRYNCATEPKYKRSLKTRRAIISDREAYYPLAIFRGLNRKQ
jgi:hypothetical protein